MIFLQRESELAKLSTSEGVGKLLGPGSGLLMVGYGLLRCWLHQTS